MPEKDMALTFENVDRSRVTPMMRQLIEQKNTVPDLFPPRDFYELFFDAVTASRELELALTGRDCGLEERRRCSVPHPR